MSKPDLTPPEGEATTAVKKDKKAAKPKKEAGQRRSKFAELYPDTAAIKVLCEANPKKEKSKSRERFEFYFTSKTVGDFLQAGGTYGDIAYDVGRQHISVG